jgi:tRNA-specific 2-thiouridylase
MVLGPVRFMRVQLDLPGDPSRTRVVVAMSGGVDSSVVAGLLKNAGYDVVGVTLQLYDHGEATHRKGACCAGQDIHDARRVAETLGIPHYVLDYEERFREKVIDGFAESYIAGETPVPCVACNQSVKFVDLLDTARKLGADALATGHYVMSKAAGNHRALHRPVDLDRDQSYFLFATTQAQLDFVRFPLGAMTKAETREAAREFGLTVADKHDSQDICFVPAAAISSTSTAAFSAITKASSITPSARGAASALRSASRSTWSTSIRWAIASSLVRARRSSHAACICAR